MTLEQFQALKAGDIIMWKARSFPEDEISDNLLLVLENQTLDGDIFEGQHELKTRMLQTTSTLPSASNEWYIHEDTHDEISLVA